MDKKLKLGLVFISSPLASRLIAIGYNRYWPSQIETFCRESQKKSFLTKPENIMPNFGS
jgi:hypothetical protein